MSKFLQFQKYNDPALAKTIGERLAAAGIQYELESQPQHLDPVFLGNTPEFSIDLKIAPEDFIRARAVLEAYYEAHLQNVDPSYYLFDFTDQELLDILAKPDEWGVFDYVLAQKLLIERGHSITHEFTEDLKAKRLRELAEFDDPASLGGSPLGLGGAVSGYILATQKKILPDGSEVPAYSPRVRKRRRMVFIIAVFVLVVTLWAVLTYTRR